MLISYLCCINFQPTNKIASHAKKEEKKRRNKKSSYFNLVSWIESTTWTLWNSQNQNKATSILFFKRQTKIKIYVLLIKQHSIECLKQVLGCQMIVYFVIFYLPISIFDAKCVTILPLVLSPYQPNSNIISTIGQLGFAISWVICAWALKIW